MKTTGRIRLRIEGIPHGEPFLSSAFLSYGPRASVDQALSRLTKEGKIARVTRGVFVRPKKNRFIGMVMPEPGIVAETIGRSTGAIVQVHGAEAARRFELTTQMPTRTIYYTSGPSRHFHVGALEVTLQHVSARKLALAGRPAGLALTALWYLGRSAVTEGVIKVIAGKLPLAEFEALKSAITMMPAWMVDAFRQYEQSAQHG